MRLRFRKMKGLNSIMNILVYVQQYVIGRIAFYENEDF